MIENLPSGLPVPYLDALCYEIRLLRTCFSVLCFNGYYKKSEVYFYLSFIEVAFKINGG